MPIVVRKKDKKKKLPDAPTMPVRAKAIRQKKSFAADTTMNPANYKYGGGTMKMDPQYKSAGGMVFKGR